MRSRYRMFRRRGYFYFHDHITGEQKSLGTKDRDSAKKLLFAKNQSSEQPALNLAMARTYLMAKSPQLVTRTWGQVMTEKEEQYRHQGTGSTLRRWQVVCHSKPFQLIAGRCLVETEPDHFLSVLRHDQAGVSSNVWLRILHNFTLDMGWLLAPVPAKKMWPKVQYKDKRGITKEEHQKILELAQDCPEEYHYYEFL